MKGLENGVKEGLLQTITSSDVGSPAFEVVGEPLYDALSAIPNQIEQGVRDAITAIHSQNPSFPIVLISPPDVGFTPFAQEANAILNQYIPSVDKDPCLRFFKASRTRSTGSCKPWSICPETSTR